MVKLLLSIKAELENVTDLIPEDLKAFDFFFKVQCSSCHEVHPKYVTMNHNDKHEIARSEANFVWKCGSCKRTHSASFDTSYPARPYSADSSGKFAPLLVVECRGLEFIDFDPRGSWTCKGVESGTPFTDIELEEREWTDYDEKASQPVGIMEVEGKWTKA